MAVIRFDDRVAVVTGAGGGLGRSHALLLASRGAKVVVNDLGGAVDGSGAAASAADAVVEEIRAAGGEAVASYDSVSDAEGASRIIETAREAYGRVDVLVNNAGILRDITFHKMSLADWDSVIAVHLTGTMNVTRAAWPTMREQGYGRIVNTSSAAGLYGNFGQSNYAAAKLGIVGLTRTLAHEGKKYDIRVNAIAPVARSRMTEELLPEEALEKLSPDLVSPIVIVLSSSECRENGAVYAVGGGYHARVAMMEGAGARIAQVTPESIVEAWETINDLERATAYGSAMEAAQQALK